MSVSNRQETKKRSYIIRAERESVPVEFAEVPDFMLDGSEARQAQRMVTSEFTVKQMRLCEELLSVTPTAESFRIPDIWRNQKDSQWDTLDEHLPSLKPYKDVTPRGFKRNPEEKSELQKVVDITHLCACNLPNYTPPQDLYDRNSVIDTIPGTSEQAVDDTGLDAAIPIRDNPNATGQSAVRHLMMKHPTFIQSRKVTKVKNPIPLISDPFVPDVYHVHSWRVQYKPPESTVPTSVLGEWLNRPEAEGGVIFYCPPGGGKSTCVRTMRKLQFNAITDRVIPRDLRDAFTVEHLRKRGFFIFTNDRKLLDETDPKNKILCFMSLKRTFNNFYFRRKAFKDGDENYRKCLLKTSISPINEVDDESLPSRIIHMPDDGYVSDIALSLLTSNGVDISSVLHERERITLPPISRPTSLSLNVERVSLAMLDDTSKCPSSCESISSQPGRMVFPPLPAQKKSTRRVSTPTVPRLNLEDSPE